MALDEPKETDETFEIENFTYVVDKEFLNKVQPINVDFSDLRGFCITANIELSAGGCGGCSTDSDSSCAC